MNEITRGPYPDELGFERWHDDSPLFYYPVDKRTTVIVNYLPNIGWGFYTLIDNEATKGQYNPEWTAKDAMVAGAAAEHCKPDLLESAKHRQ